MIVLEIERRILALIDEMVEYASDDELFAGGYLCGHLTLAVAEIATQDSSVQAMYQAVGRSLDQAIERGELSPPDQVLVRKIWDKLFQQAQAAS